MHLASTIVALISSIHLTVAYQNNCKGSSRSPNVNDCNKGINNIDAGRTYTDQAQFSVGNCYIIYATNGAGPQPLSGSIIRATAQNILNSCSSHHGSFGTNNCEACHVTVNYRAPVLAAGEVAEEVAEGQVE